MNAVYKTEEGALAVQSRYRDFLDRWPVTNERIKLSTCEGDTFAITCGPKEGPPILLLHGSATNSFIWTEDIPEWARDFRIYAVDLIGEPGLSAPSRPPLDSDSYALWLDDVLEGLGISSASIVGASLGGWLALDYAIRRPKKVSSLALLCPGGVGRQKVGFFFTAIPLLMFGDWGRRKAMEIAIGPMPDDQVATHQAFADFFALILEHVRTRTVTLPIFSDDELQRLSVPLMTIVGGQDAIFDSDDTKRRLEENVPQAEIHYLPDIGHGLLEQTSLVGDFLRRANGVQDSAASLGSST